jgi:NTE family protein
MGSPENATPAPPGGLALVMSGGGARAAYQAGVLLGLSRHFPELHIPILSGISAGAINQSFLACLPGDFAEKSQRLARLWSELQTDQVLDVRSTHLLRKVVSWGLRLVSGGHLSWAGRAGMIDLGPLRETLGGILHARDGLLGGIDANLASGSLSAFAITTASYGTGRSVTWVQGRPIDNWERANRVGVGCKLSVDHVLASAALPLLFPAVRIGDDYHGDGGMRQTAPLSPAIHLGADRILAISTRFPTPLEAHPRATPGPVEIPYPPPAQIAGALLGTIFLDQFDNDALRLERINRLVADTSTEDRQGLRPIRLLIIRPSQDLGGLAQDYEARLPAVFRWLQRGMGTRREGSNNVLLSMLMFQRDYARRLIEVGEADAERHVEAAAELFDA